MSNRSATYTLTLNSNVRQSLVDTEREASKLDGTMASIRNTLTGFYAAMSLKEGFHVGEEILQTAADYEQAMLRIKNVSENDVQGIKNQMFISEEVDKFKIDMQKATEGYGEFLTMVRGSALAASEVRKLHDEVLLISKVTGLSDGQLDAGVRNLGKMLESGTIDVRHLRPLRQQISGLEPYIAKELGMSNQELSKAMSDGSLTKSAIDSRHLVKAIDAYSEDLGGKLPSTLLTLQSTINDTRNEWERFIISMGKSEDMRSALELVQETTHGLHSHHSEVQGVIKSIIEMAVVYAAYKGVMAGFNGTLSAINAVESQSLYFSEYGISVNQRYAIARREAAISIGFEKDELTALNNVSAANTEANVGIAESMAMRSASIEEANLSIYQQMAAIEQSTLQMDLYTQAQAAGSLGLQEFTKQLSFFGSESVLALEMATEQLSLFTDTELGLTNVIIQQIDAVELNRIAFEKANAELIASAKLVGAQWVLAGGSMQRSAQSAAQEMGIAGKLAGDGFVTGAEEAIAAWEAATISINSNMMNVQRMSMGQMAAINRAAISGLPTVGGITSGLGGMLINGAMSVFIVGAAAGAIASAMGWGQSKDFKESMFDGFTDMFNFGKSSRVGEEVGVHEALQKSLDENFRIRKDYVDITKNPRGNNLIDFYSKDGMSDFGTNKLDRRLPDTGFQLYEQLGKMQESINKSGLNVDLLSKFVTYDKYGKQSDVSNSSLADKFRDFGYDIPKLMSFDTDKEETKNESDFKSNLTSLKKIGKTSQIKGNSVTNINIQVDQMNGINNSSFPISSQYDEKRIQDVVGAEMVRQMTDALNDAQHVAGKR